jgi:Fic family protein
MAGVAEGTGSDRPEARGRAVSIDWSGRRARAWVPDVVAPWQPSFDAPLARTIERAAAAVRRADELLPGTWEPIARILLRTEGVASSDIEGLRAPIEAVVAAEVDDAAVDPSAAWVADNLAVVNEAIRSARRSPLTIDRLHRWHRRLMRHGTLPAPMVGRFRTAQGWIGGTSPLDAVYVPPPPGEVGGLMADLVRFANRDDLDVVAQAAVLHAQFETIHPYGDGNGRLGRVLISWLLVRRLGVALPPPVSVLVARDPGGYLSGLYQYREGSLDAYVGWFAGVVTRAGDASVVLGERIRDLLEAWRARGDDLRVDSAARRLIEVLPEQPVTTSAAVAARLEVSERAARGALIALGARGIVRRTHLQTPSTIGRPRSWWTAPELVTVVTAWAG